VKSQQPDDLDEARSLLTGVGVGFLIWLSICVAIWLTVLQ